MKNGSSRYANGVHHIFIVLLVGGFLVLSGCGFAKISGPKGAGTTSMEASYDPKTGGCRLVSAWPKAYKTIDAEYTCGELSMKIHAEGVSGKDALNAALENNKAMAESFNKFMSDSAEITSNVMAPGASSLLKSERIGN